MINYKQLYFIFLVILVFIPSVYAHEPTKYSENKKIEITDSIGRKVMIPGKIERIACMYAFTGHVAAMLDRCDDIVAVVNGLKRDKILGMICPSIENAAVPKYNSALNIEALVKARPDVVFMKESAFYQKADFEMIDKFNIPVVVISFNDINSQIKAVKIIGDVLGESEKAGKYIEYYIKCVNEAISITKNIPAGQRIKIYHAVLEPLKTDAAESLSADWIMKAGLNDVSVTAGIRSGGEDTFVSLEQVILWNPEAIIVNEEGIDKYIREDARWKDIKAVKDGRVYKMPTGISRWGHPGSLETPLALLWAMKTFYPDLSRSIDLRKETRNFYGAFFRFYISDDMADKILSGEGMRQKKNKKNKNNI